MARRSDSPSARFAHGDRIARARVPMDRWRSWNAAKLPGRAVNRFVRGWVSRRLTIEVHRTACIVTHPPAGERSNDALVNPANERLAGTRFTPDECWRELYGDPLTGRWARDYATYPFQSIDGLVTEFGGDGLLRELEAVEEVRGVRCPAGGAVLTRSHGELKELYGALLHAVAPFYPGEAEAAAEAATVDWVASVDGPGQGWEATLTRTYRASLDEAMRHGLRSVAMPLLGAGARGARGDVT